MCAYRYPDGSVRLRNPNIELMDQDILYHLALGSGSHDLIEMFGDVKVLLLIVFFCVLTGPVCFYNIPFLCRGGSLPIYYQ
jgi:hypothetical protein